MLLIKTSAKLEEAISAKIKDYLNLEKRIKENSARIDGKKEILEEIQNLHKAKEEALEAKKKELEEIISETEREEKILMEESLLNNMEELFHLFLLTFHPQADLYHMIFSIFELVLHPIFVCTHPY